MQSKELLTSVEAIALFEKAGLSEATFYRKVRDEKVIDKILPKGRTRGARYPKEQVEKVIQIEGNLPPEKKEEPAAETDWIQTNDLPYILAYDLEMYGIENTVDISITHAWWKKNPYMCRVLFDKKDRRNIWGGITIIPMQEEKIFQLLRGEIEERDITPDDILTYEPGKEYYGYIASATVKPERRNHFRKLLRNMLAYWCEQYPNIRFKKLYAYASSSEGWDLVSHLFFAPRYDIGENAFELDPYRRNPSKIITEFQDCIRNKDNSKLKR